MVIFSRAFLNLLGVLRGDHVHAHISVCAYTHVRMSFEEYVCDVIVCACVCLESLSLARSLIQHAPLSARMFAYVRSFMHKGMHVIFMHANTC